MTALTLVMNELDMDADEFYNVRAYHTRSQNYRQSLCTTGSRSPTNSESSGFISLGSSSPDIWEGSSLSVTPPLTVKPVCSTEPTKNESPDSTQSAVDEARNIFDLGKNLHPYKWQLRPAMFGKSLLQREWVHFRSARDTPSGGLRKCEDCGFLEPLFH